MDIKKPDKKLYYLILIIAAAAVLMIFGGGEKETKNPVDERERMEQSLKNVLKSVRGAGEVNVFINFDDDGVKNYEKNVRQSNETMEKTTVLSGADNSPAVIKYSFPSVKGVIITAQGADDRTVKENLKTAAETALNVPSHRVCVLTGK